MEQSAAWRRPGSHVAPPQAHQFLVQFDPEAWPIGQRHPAIDNGRLRRYEFAAHGAVEHMRGDIFEDGCGGTGRLEVAAHGGSDAGLPAMRHDFGAHQLAEIGDAPDLGEAATASDIGLDDADLARRDPLADLEAGSGRLSTTDADGAPLREPCMAFDVVMLERGLGEEDVMLGDAFQNGKSVMPVVPAVSEFKSLKKSDPDKVVVAVYGFTDKTGQRKPSDKLANISFAVTQGAESVLIEDIFLFESVDSLLMLISESFLNLLANFK